MCEEKKKKGIENSQQKTVAKTNNRLEMPTLKSRNVRNIRAIA